MNEAATAEEPATRARVVVIVAERAAGAEAAARPTTAAEAAPAQAAASAAAVAPVARSVGAPKLPPPEERPTERVRKAPSAPRGPEDERIVAALIPIDPGAEPAPLDDFLGRSLLYRAAHAAARAGVPRLIIVGRFDEALQRRLYEEAYAGFGGRTVEVRAEDPAAADFGRGRVLILDGAALHDPASIRRLAQARGPRTVLLLGKYGEGLRVKSDEGRVRDIGYDVSGWDGIMAGACSVPVEHFARMTQVGERAALEEFMGRDELVAIVAPRTFGQQFEGRKGFDAAKDPFFDALAAGSSPSGSFDDLLGRPLARVFTQFMLHRPGFTPAGVSIAAGVLALVGAFLIATAGALGAVVAALLLVLSAVLDRSDGELARLRLSEDEDERYLDFGLDHVAHVVVFLALAFAVQRTGELSRALELLPAGVAATLGGWDLSPFRLGLLASFGVVILVCVLLWRGAPRADAGGLRGVGDLLASAFNSRDYFWLLAGAAVVNLALPGAGVMGLFLLVTTLLVHLLWAGILLCSLGGPAPGDD